MFSLLYYGFPFPNTMYAKTNIDLPRHAIILQHGVNYWIDNLQRDIVTPLTTFLAMGAAVIAPATVRKPVLALAAGIATNYAYVTYIGGDFMIGRFIANAFLLSTFTIYLCMRNDGVKRERPKLWCGRTAVVLLALAVVNLHAHTPINSPKDWETYDDPNGAIDIRGWRFPETSLHQYFAQRKSGEFFPDANPAYGGLNIKHDTSRQAAHIVGGMGMVGYHAGTDKAIFDVYGLSSPVVARMNGHPESWTGHYYRDIPQDLLLAHQQGSDIIKDPPVQQYYRKMNLVTQSPNLLAPERLREILLLNTVHRKLHLAYADGGTGKGAQPAHVRE